MKKLIEIRIRILGHQRRDVWIECCNERLVCLKITLLANVEKHVFNQKSATQASSAGIVEASVTFCHFDNSLLF